MADTAELLYSDIFDELLKVVTVRERVTPEQLGVAMAKILKAGAKHFGHEKGVSLDRYKGVWKADAAYSPGDTVTRNGLWLCTNATSARPGAGLGGWRLIVKEIVKDTSRVRL